METFSWKEIDSELPEPWIISRMDSGIRAFGFWKAWQEGADCVFTIDDDCEPSGDDLVAGHLRNLHETPNWQSTVPGLRVRGLPYRNFGGPLPVDVSVGLWLGAQTSTPFSPWRTRERDAAGTWCWRSAAG